MAISGKRSAPKNSSVLSFLWTTMVGAPNACFKKSTDYETELQSGFPIWDLTPCSIASSVVCFSASFTEGSSMSDRHFSMSASLIFAILAAWWRLSLWKMSSPYEFTPMYNLNSLLKYDWFNLYPGPNSHPKLSRNFLKVFWIKQIYCCEEPLSSDAASFNQNIEGVLNEFQRELKVGRIPFQILVHVYPFSWDHHGRPVPRHFHYTSQEEGPQHQIHWFPMWTIPAECLLHEKKLLS